MTLPPDALYTVLACTTVASVGALSIAVLPWRDAELTDSWLAWTALFGLLRHAARRVRDVGSLYVTTGQTAGQAPGAMRSA